MAYQIRITRDTELASAQVSEEQMIAFEKWLLSAYGEGNPLYEAINAMNKAHAEQVERRKAIARAVPEKFRWVSARGKHLVQGTVMRTLINEKVPENGYIYAISSGSGFGCDPASTGRAIFVESEAHTLEKCLAGEGKSTRWERYWNIDIMEE